LGDSTLVTGSILADERARRFISIDAPDQLDIVGRAKLD
jgi:hypothetical protein